MPHTDGPLYSPTIATITLGSHTVLDFYKHLDAKENAAAAAVNDQGKYYCQIQINLVMMAQILLPIEFIENFIVGLILEMRHTSVNVFPDSVVLRDNQPEPHKYGKFSL